MQQKLTQIEQQFAQQLEQQKLAHDQLLRTASFRHAIGEAALLKEALGADDSAMATIITGAIGERSMAETADSLNADRDRRQEQAAEEAAQEREWRREMERYERQIARENARMGYDLEVQRLKMQASVVVAAVERGLADHQNVEFLMSELRSVAKQLEDASANASQREKEQAESPGPPDLLRAPEAPGTTETHRGRG